MFPLLGFTRCNNFEAQCTPGLFKIVVQTLITLLSFQDLFFSEIVPVEEMKKKYYVIT